jgi:HSP20 family protein
MLPVFKNSWFPTVFDDFLNTDFMPRANSTAPAVNVREDEKAYTMEVAAPGIRKEFCRVSINDDGNLCVAIENKTEHKEDDRKHHYLRREFSYTNYEQNYALPEDVDSEKISAKVENGILTVVLPKKTKVETKVSKTINVA